MQIWVAKLWGLQVSHENKLQASSQMPESLGAADILGVVRSPSCLYPSVCLHWDIHKLYVSAFWGTAILFSSASPHFSQLCTACLRTPQSPQDTVSKIPTIPHFHHFGFQIYSFANFFLFLSQPSDCCQFKNYAQLYKSSSFPLCLTGICIPLTPPLFLSHFR